ncbi:MAG: hypothetical protein HYZ85_05370 [Candidatus Omnitrophica bacterium]|nr:hypothetical protein [Candidatus Omnitrophota bacterium]
MPDAVTPRKSTAVSSKTAEPPSPNLFAEQFFMKPSERLPYRITELKGLLIVESENPQALVKYSVVTDFGKGALRTQQLQGLKDIKEIRVFLDENLKTAEFEGVEIKRLVFQTKDREKRIYWVGHRAFDSAETAKAQIVLVQSIAETQGLNFSEMVKGAKDAMRVPEQEEPVEIKTPAQFQKEEELFLKFADQLDIGNEMFGPFQGEGTSEPITWQSFGETTWRATNLDRNRFNAQVGFWTNRLVFKGIKAPLSSIDPYVEATTALESHGKDFSSHLDLFAGAEWRPFARNPWFYNYRPAGLPLLDWVRNYRLYVQYGDRKNLKDEIQDSKDYEIIYGVQIYYEGGIDLPPVSEGPPSGFGDYLREYGWWEYFGNYRFEKTNFTSQEDFNAWILNSSIHLGLKLPGIPLPDVSPLDEIVLMPYLRFEHVNNTEFSFSYQNQYFLAAGIRWMPFRTYRFKENEWLSKTKLFAEYVGVGDTQYAKQDGEPKDAIEHDLRFGVSISQRRF